MRLFRFQHESMITALYLKKQADPKLISLLFDIATTPEIPGDN
jgi:hypothetical protein